MEDLTVAVAPLPGQRPNYLQQSPIKSFDFAWCISHLLHHPSATSPPLSYFTTYPPHRHHRHHQTNHRTIKTFTGPSQHLSLLSCSIPLYLPAQHRSDFFVALLQPQSFVNQLLPDHPHDSAHPSPDLTCPANPANPRTNHSRSGPLSPSPSSARPLTCIWSNRASTATAPRSLVLDLLVDLQLPLGNPT